MTDVGEDREILDRLCDRLRSASEARLTRLDQGPDRTSVAELVHETLRWAALSQGVTREVPRLHPLASGDQLAVLGSDFLDWASETPGRDGELDQWRERLGRVRTSI